ncbi:hypothetical protein DUI87_27296 [Hirundo rustica rustica]|uniref:Uncharacterized protein n=1 Tax=Hirundo rustica rustica TaxID=333673 RepID=A0A3M0JBG6_HIRRU|nr:hypothetical protein DUI87_27296 [Hirundo rustica rustica]
MRWKTLEEGIQQLREVAVLEVHFGRGGQHDNDPDTSQVHRANAVESGNSRTISIRHIHCNNHPDNNRKTVGPVANKLRNYESIISGPMQAQVSAVAKELREGDEGDEGGGDREDRGDDEEEQFPCGTGSELQAPSQSSTAPS